MLSLGRIRKTSWVIFACAAVSILYIVHSGLEDKSGHISDAKEQYSNIRVPLKFELEVKELLDKHQRPQSPNTSAAKSLELTKQYNKDELNKDAANFNADEDKELLAAAKRAELKSAQRVIINNALAKEYNNPLLTLCELFEEDKPFFATKDRHFNASQSYNDCRQSCTSAETVYATLFKGVCYCYSITRHKSIVDLEVCDATCERGNTLCNVETKRHGITMRTGSKKDGDSDWTVWMTMPDMRLRVRYRNCTRDRFKPTACIPEFERSSDVTPLASEIVGNKFIGCFTGRSINGTSLVKHQRTFRTKLRSHLYCQDFCGNLQTTYAVLSTERMIHSETRDCYCVDSLGQSRPTDSCSGLGFAVHWTSASTKPILRFEPEVKKKGKVLILARYRSGSSMTQSFFARNPNSFALFEPGKLMSANENADKAMLAVLEAVYSCDIYRIPLFFHNSVFMLWSYKMLTQRGSNNNFAKDVVSCLYVKPKVNCAPYLQEACEQAEFINVKTIRIFSSDAIKEFVQRNNDVHIIHLVRDPRGLLAAQRSYGSKPSASFVCEQLVEIGKLVQELKSHGSKTIHEVFYEQLAVNASYYGAKMYREIGIKMPPEVSHFLSRDDYENLSKIPKNANQVIVEDPTFHVYRFLQKYSFNDILKIDDHCDNVYNFWPEHYSNFLTMYQQHTEEIDHYIPDRTRDKVHRYLSEKGQSAVVN